LTSAQILFGASFPVPSGKREAPWRLFLMPATGRTALSHLREAVLALVLMI